LGRRIPRGGEGSVKSTISMVDRSIGVGSLCGRRRGGSMDMECLGIGKAPGSEGSDCCLVSEYCEAENGGLGCWVVIGCKRPR